ATVIVWGLCSSMVLTLFFVPVGYRLLVPPVPHVHPVEEEEARFVEPLPDVSAADVVILVVHLEGHAGEHAVYGIADELNWEFARVIAVVKAAEMLGLVETPGEMVVLTGQGREFAAAGTEARRALWRDQLLQLRLFRDVYDALQRQPDR